MSLNSSNISPLPSILPPDQEDTFKTCWVCLFLTPTSSLNDLQISGCRFFPFDPVYWSGLQAPKTVGIKSSIDGATLIAFSHTFFLLDLQLYLHEGNYLLCGKALLGESERAPLMSPYGRLISLSNFLFAWTHNGTVHFFTPDPSVTSDPWGTASCSVELPTENCQGEQL